MTNSLGSRGLGIALLSGSTSLSGSCNFHNFSFSGQFWEILKFKGFNKHQHVSTKFRRPPQISWPEGCVRSCGCKVARFSDFPTAIFSSKIAIFNSYIDFWPFKTQNEWLFIKNPVLKNFLGLKTQCSISKFYKIIRFLDFYLRIPKMY